MQRTGLTSPIQTLLAGALTLVTAHASAEQPPPGDVHPRANLRGRDLSGARFELARLMRADFTGADLSGAVFDSADLSRANLSRVNLTNTTFVQSAFTGANFTGVDFTTNVRFEGGSSVSVQAPTPLDKSSGGMSDGATTPRSFAEMASHRKAKTLRAC